MSLALVRDLSVDDSQIDPEQAVAIVLSRCLTGLRSGDESHTNVLCKVLAYYGRAPIPQRGRHRAASHPDLPTGPWPTGSTALRQCGLTGRRLRDEFRQRRYAVGPIASIDGVVLRHFVPEVLWSVVEQLAMDGPGLAAIRGELAIQAAAAELVPATKRRPAGRPAAGTVASWRDALRRVFGVLAELRAEEVPWDALKSWHGVPRLRLPDLAPGTLDASGPRLPLIRLAWGRLNEQIAQGLDISVGDDELAALDAKSDTALIRASLFRALRGRVALGLLVLTGSRISAIAELRRADYLPHYQGPAPDHRCGPALRIRPGKTLHPDLTRVKMIPPAFARCIDAMLEYRDRCVAARLRHRGRPRAASDQPLLLSDRVRERPWKASGIRTYFSGLPPREGTRGVPALIPRETGVNPEFGLDQRNFVGYTPHSFRHAASALAETAGERWNERHARSTLRPYEPALYATALEDHATSEDRMRALYGDRDTEDLREVLAARAIEGIWALLTTAEGAKRTPDRQAIRDCLERREALKEHKTFLEHRVDELYIEARNDGGSADLILRVMEISDEIRRTVEHLARADVRLRDLRYDRRFWAILPDSAPPGPAVDFDDLEQALLDDLRADRTSRKQSPAPIRPYVTVAEFEWIVGAISRAELSRWLRGMNLPKRRDRRPWDADVVPVDGAAGASHYRRIDVRGVKQTFWRGEAMRHRLAETLARWPEGRGWAVDQQPNWRCLAPLQAPGCIRWEGPDE